jgi:hypothetical protein
MQNTSEEILRLYVREQAARELTEEKLDEALINWFQTGLDIVGLIPGIGEFADAANALISLARGNNLDALLSVISFVPVYGDAIGKGSKLALAAIKPLMKNRQIAKIAAEAGQQVGKISASVDPAIVGKMKKVAGEAGDVISTINKNSEGIQQIYNSMKDGDLPGFLKAMGMSTDLGDNQAMQSLFSTVSKKLAGGQLGEQLGGFLQISAALEQARMGLLDKKPAVAAESVNLNVSTLRENYEYLWVE